jgi:hypothetical protein
LWLPLPLVDGVDFPNLEGCRYSTLGHAPVDQVLDGDGQDLNSLLQHGRRDAIHPQCFRIVQAFYRL